MGHKGEAEWSWIPKIKEVVDIPVVLNGNVLTPQDVKEAFDKTNADGVMIARGAIGNPWIFKEAKELLNDGYISAIIDEEIRIKTCLRHLELAIKVKGERRAILEHRKFYSGYLRGLPTISQIRKALMEPLCYREIEDILLSYSEKLKGMNVPVDFPI